MDESASSIIAGQNKDYAKSLFTDSVMKNPEFQKHYETYRQLSPLDKEAEISLLEEKMKEFYVAYLNQCDRDRVVPFVPSGTLGFLAAGIALPGARLLTPFEEMDRVADLYCLKGPVPKCQFSAIYHMIHAVLVPKYQGACIKNYEKSQLNVSEQEEFLSACIFMTILVELSATKIFSLLP